MKEEEKLKSKHLYKLELYLIKMIPIIISVLYFLNTTLSYFGINTTFCSMIGGMSILPLLFLYLSSIVFKFCAFHRLFIHYITINEIISWTDYTIHLPIGNDVYFLLYLLLTIIFIIIAVKLRIK